MMPARSSRTEDVAKFLNPMTLYSQNPALPELEMMRQFPLWLISTTEKVPCAQKFILGDRMQTTALDVEKRPGLGDLSWGNK